jgi:hypothetical protein
MISINIVAVLVAAIVTFVIGFLFHGPVFGKVWMRLAHVQPTGNEKFSNMIPQMLKNLFANIVCAYVLAMFIAVSASYFNNAGSAMGGIEVAFWVWLGFIVTGSSMDVIWMGKSKKLWVFELVASLVGFVAMGALLAVW